MTHKLIKTDNYLLVVDDTEIREGDYWHYIGELEKPILNYLPSTWYDNLHDKNKYKKVISHLPLNNAPILEGVDLLPNIEDDIDVNMFYYRNLLNPYPSDTPSHTGYKKGFEEGYNKSREKYKYTEEDIRKAFSAGLMNRYSRTGEAVAETEFIQSLSQYPTEFEAATEPYTVGEMSELPLGTVNQKIKTTTNAQGKRVWVGKYL